MALNASLLARTLDVINSCRTLKQLAIASQYRIRAVPYIIAKGGDRLERYLAINDLDRQFRSYERKKEEQIRKLGA